jgi:hypothetical protein
LTATNSRRVILGMRSLIASLILASFAVSAIGAERWTQFRDPAGNFTVEFQQAPGAVTAAGISVTGASVPISTYAVGDGANIMMVADTPVFDRTHTSSEIIEMVANRALREATSTGGMVQSDMPDMLDGQLGRRLSILRADGSVQTSRVFYFNGHAYTVITITMGGANRARVADALHFSQSLHLTAPRQQ